MVNTKNEFKKCSDRVQYKFNLNTINKLIKMQQNVQSERLMEAANYSQHRNSIPSKIPDSDILLHRYQRSSHEQPVIPLQNDHLQPQQTQQQEERLKLIEEEIKREKELIEKLRQENQRQKQEIQNSMNKSFLSLSPNHLQAQNNDYSVSGHDELLQTKTQADMSFLENRKNNATKQLETEEQKYRENIRKMQLRKAEMKRKLKQDQQIPIKIMDFNELQKKKELKQDEQPEPQKEKNIMQQEKQTQKKPSQKSSNLKKDVSKESSKIKAASRYEVQQNENIENVLIETQSKKPQSHAESTPKSHKSRVISVVKEHQASQKQSELINKSKFCDNKSHSKSKVNQQSGVENKSRISAISSNKKYSVKKSSVVVPEFNESIKQIQERRERQSQKVQSQRSSHHEANQQINIEPKVVQQSRSRISSVKKSEIQKSIHSQKNKSLKQQHQNSVKDINDEMSVKDQVKSKSISEKSEAQPGNSEKSQIKNKNFEEVQDKQSVKQKSVSKRSKASSKKEQKIELMYIPHVQAVKQPSIRSFKKTDKSIQWSEVDISMYGKTNEVPISHQNSHIISQLNQQNNTLQQQTEQSRLSNQIDFNKINMKKNKNNQKVFFEQVSQKDKISEKKSNLAPIQSNKDKSERESLHSRSSHSKQKFFAGSRQGSVKQKTQRYDQFQREHSLNNKKIESKKLAMIENMDALPGSKQPSYRSRKSNPVSNSSVSKSRVETVVKKQQSQSQKQPSSEIVKNPASELQESKILVSKQEINLLHSHIKRLEQKLLRIEEKQQKLAKEKEEELAKLQQIAIQQQKLAEEARKQAQIQVDSRSIKNDDETQNLLENQIFPIDQSLSKQLVNDSANIDKINHQEEPKNQQIKIEEEPQNNNEAEKIQVVPQNLQNDQAPQPTQMQKSFISQKHTIQQEINQIAVIQAKFTQQKQQLLEEINKLKKIIRDLQIQKIKSIDHDKTITSKDDPVQKRPETQQNETGIIHVNKKNQTIEPIFIGHQDQSNASPIGRIVKNQSPQKNSSRVIQNLDPRNKSTDRKFRINLSKKSSILSDNLISRQFQSAEFSGKGMNSFVNDDEGNDLLERKKKEAYPIKEKEGYIVLSPQKEPNENHSSNQTDFKFQENKEEIKLPEISQSKIRKAELMKDQILQKFHRTNRQFNNFIESSRIINETNSSMSSQNNFFFDKTHQGPFSSKKVSNQEEEDNPQNTRIFNKLSSSNLDLHKESQNNEFQQNFTRIVESIKHQDANPDESDDQMPEIEVRDIQMPQLAKTPDITYDQDQLMKLAQETFKLFDIEVNYEDADFNMKKYKNCVIFTKGAQTILWHYNGKFYIGGWKGKEDGSGEKTGYGIEIVPEKHIYKGQFMNGKKHGTGILKTTNGNIYDGQWIQGIKNGQGVYYDATTKVVYQGEWKDGKKNGFGILKFSEKQYYKGTFVKSVKDGYGIEVFINGDKYKGEYRKGKFHGKGKYTWANTSVFQGDFYEGMRHGNGCWKSAKINGDIYVGSYSNDKKSGYGRYIWSNGCIYEGNFAEDVKHGKGRLTYTDGKQIKGVWEEGSLLQAVTQNSKQHNQEDILKRASKIKAR